MNLFTAQNIFSSARLLLMISLAVGGAALLQKRIRPQSEPADSFIESALIASAWLVVSTTALGIFGFISPLNLLLADLFFFILAFLISSGKKIARNENHSVRPPKYPFPVRLIVILFFLLAAASWTWAWVSPPPPWDAFVYHLSFPAAWIKSGGIFPVTVPFGDQAGTYFPSNVELIYLRLLSAPGQDFATNVLQWFFLIFISIVIYRLSETTGAGNAESIAAAAVPFFIPILFHQSVTSEVDILFAAYFITFIYFLLRWADRPTINSYLYYSFLSLGLFLGSKTISVVFTLLIAAPLIIYLSFKKHSFLQVVCGCLIAAATGGYWYVRNLLLTGNPVYPLSVSFFGKPLFPGAYDRHTMLQSVFHTDSFREWLGLLSNGYGLPIIFLLLFGILFSLFKSRGHLRIKVIAAIPVAITAICFFVIPYNREVRFLFSAFLISCVALAWAAGQMTNRNRRLFLVIILIACLANVVWSAVFSSDPFHLQLGGQILNLFLLPGHIYRMMAPAALTFGAASIIFIYILINRMIFNIRPKAEFVLLPLVSFLFFVGLILLSAVYPKYQYEYYSSFTMGRSWLAMHEMRPDAQRVAYSGTDIDYGLTGPWLKNDVYYVPITEWDTHYFHECTNEIRKRGLYSVPDTNRIDFCRREPDYETWLSRLKELSTTLLYVSVLHPNDLPHLAHDPEGFPIERQWADSHTEHFRLFFSNRQVRIYDFIF